MCVCVYLYVCVCVFACVLVFIVYVCVRFGSLTGLLIYQHGCRGVPLSARSVLSGPSFTVVSFGKAGSVLDDARPPGRGSDPAYSHCVNDRHSNIAVRSGGGSVLIFTVQPCPFFHQVLPMSLSELIPWVQILIILKGNKPLMFNFISLALDSTWTFQSICLNKYYLQTETL